MATISDIVASGGLLKFKPLLDIGQMECRVIYVTPEAYEWCYSSGELGRPSPNPLEFASLHAAFTDFCAGAPFDLGDHIKRLDLEKEQIDVWEIKTTPPDAVRAFGWFHNYNVFVVTHCEFRKNLKKFKSFQPHKDKVVKFTADKSCKYAPGFGRLKDEKKYFDL